MLLGGPFPLSGRNNGRAFLPCRCWSDAGEDMGGGEGMAVVDCSKLWVIGTELARAVGIPKTNLYRAAQAGQLQTSRSGCGRLLTTLAEVQKWQKRG